MKKIATIIAIAILFILQTNLNSQNQNSKIHPYLQVKLLEASNNEMLNVYATLNEQYPLGAVRQQTYFLPKKERQKEVVRILREFTFAQQREVKQYLENAKQQNRVSRIDVLWAANTIVFTAVPEIIYYLAENFDEISEIRYEAQIDENLLLDITEPSLPVSSLGETDNPVPQPGLTLINAPAVWAAGDSGQGIITANHDSGCDWDHPDLVNNIWNNLGEDFDNDGHTIELSGSTWIFDPGDVNGVDDDANGYVDDFIGWDFLGNDNNPGPNGTHGTQTAGIICGDGTNGTQTGVAPKAKLINCKLSGEATAWLAVQYSVAAGVDVITSSHSYKWYFSPKPNYPMHRQMNDFVLAAGVIQTNSTSNDGNNLGSAPIPYNISAPGNTVSAWLHPDQTLVGGISSVTGVGNVNAGTDIIMSSSPHGPAAWEDIQSVFPSYPYVMPLSYQDYPFQTSPGAMGLLKPDVSAPGNGTVTTSDGGGYSSFSGTSGATPHVCGTAALLLSANPLLTPEDVAMILQTTAVEKGAPGKDSRYGAGRIDTYEAYLLALSMIPVELVSFTASSNDNTVILNWSTATETNNSGFSVERKSAHDSRWVTIGFVPGFGTTSENKSYTFKDVNLKSDIYSYRLKQIDHDGTFEYSNSVDAEILSPNDYHLAQNYPNPFNPSTTIEYSIPEKSMVRLNIYSVQGELIATIVNQNLDAGFYKAEFDASQIPSGVYVYQVIAVNDKNSFVSSKKMILLK